MARMIRWRDATRGELSPGLGSGVVVLPLGATEQHGPHLATGTDAIVVEGLVVRAAERAAADSPGDILVAPTLPVGASAHHLPFGGTLSLRPETLLAVLGDIVDSIEVQGGRRLLIVNGHGGNHGVSRAVASLADARRAITVASVDYWELGGLPSPGHAGAVETSLMLAFAPELVRDRPERRSLPQLPAVPGVAVHDRRIWERLDGFSDQPAEATAERGAALLDDAVVALGAVIAAFARIP